MDGPTKGHIKGKEPDEKIIPDVSDVLDLVNLDRASIINKFGEQILESRYYSKKDTCPEDVFWRVAQVVSIPDVIDWLCEKETRDPLGVFTWTAAFEPFEDLAKLVCERCGLKKFKVSTVIDEIKKKWGQEIWKYYNIIRNLDFMPASPTLLNAGRTGMLSSCFFMRPKDSLEDIFQTLKEVAIVMKRGGGVGLDFSEIRPKNSKVGTVNGVATGPISYMHIFDEMGDHISQGSIRKAAMLASLRVDHPDIIEFISCKKQERTLHNFNISVLITDKFMEAVEGDLEFELNHSALDESIKIQAREIWNAIAIHAHNNGEPGVIFQDEMDRGDVFKGKFGKLGVNPCSELPLSELGSCALGAINLRNCFDEEFEKIDWKKLERLVKLGVRFIDNTLDLNDYPLPEIEEVSLRERKIGLGVMGLHDLLLLCKLPYDYGNAETKSLIDELFGVIKTWANEESERLGKSRGIPEKLGKLGIKRRNANLLTCQPCGSVSLISNQVSNGIEPIFNWIYTRKDSHGTREIKHSILDKFPEDQLPEYAKTALEILPDEHVKMQAAIQKHIDSSISKTVNMSNGVLVSDVERAFKLAYELKCKSVAVYREGSRQEEVLSKKRAIDSKKDKEKLQKSLTRGRPRFLPGITFRMNTPGGKAYVTINEDDEGIREVFMHISKAGSEIGSHVEAEGRLISYALKHRNPVAGLINHLSGQKSNPIWEYGRSIKSVPDAVAKCMQEYIDRWEGFSVYLEDYIDEDSKEEKRDEELKFSGDLCTHCGEPLFMEGKCEVCKSCGFSSCG